MQSCSVIFAKVFAFPALLATLFATAPALAAPRMDERLYDLGSRICADIANGALEVPGAQSHIDNIDAVGGERSEFCHCVGEEFGLNPAQKARMEISEGEAAADAMLEILMTNMQICSAGHMAYGELITSKDDAWQCRQIVDGDRKMRGLDMKPVQAAMKEHGLDREDICTCAAGFITAMEDLIDAKPLGMDMPSASYQMQMATGIRHCANL